MKVHFVVAGMQKSGTTTLHRLLAQHPHVHVAPIKGTHFFDTESHFAGDEIDYAAYHAFFSPTPSHRVIGEATPIYSFWEPSMRRIAAYNPWMKVIVVLRNPIERAYSHWNFLTGKRIEHLGFEEALAAEEERTRASLPLQSRHFSYVARGFYTPQLERIASLFPAEQRLVLRMEELIDPESTAMDRVWSLLGVERPPSTEPAHANRRGYASPMAPAVREKLREVFRAEIGSLERMLGWDLRDWLADDGEGAPPDGPRATPS